MKEILIKILDTFGKACWVKVETQQPSCIYYFGPFLHNKDAQSAKIGYIEDLRQEGAVDIKVDVIRCKPTELTVVTDWEENLDFQAVPVLSPQ